MELEAIVEAAKALTLAPKTVRDMTQLLRETQKNGGIQTNKKNTNEHTKQKPRLNTQKNTRPNRAV